jgi:hypothetical protein
MTIYLLTAIGLPPGGSCTVHIYTQTLHRTTQNKQYIKQHKNFENNTKILEECGPCPDLASYTLAFALQLRKKHGKTCILVCCRPANRPSNPGCRRFFLSSKRPYWLWGPPSLLFDGYRRSFPGLIRSGRDVNHSPQSSAEIKNEWRYTSSPLICLHGVDRENIALFISAR